MRTIHVGKLPSDEELVGKNVVVPVLVDWFPGLTLDECYENAVARINGEPDPYPNPNVIEVVIER